MKLTLVDLLKVRDRKFRYPVKTAKEGEASASFDVTIINARTRYGTVDVLIQPVAGEGAFWVEYGRLIEIPSTETPSEPPTEKPQE
jgi:hypothetical protein